MLSDLREISLHLRVEIRLGIKHIIDKHQLVVLDIAEGRVQVECRGPHFKQAGVALERDMNRDSLPLM